MLALIFIYPPAEVAPLYYSYSVLGGWTGGGAGRWAGPV